MKKIKKYKLWIVRIIFFILIPCIILAILYYSDNLKIIYNTIHNKVSSLGIITITTYVILFLSDIVKGWFSSYITDSIFPDEIQSIKKDTKDIIKNQDAVNLKIENILNAVNFNTKNIKNYLTNLNKLKTFEEQIQKIEALYNNDKILLKEKEFLLLALKNSQITLSKFQTALNEIRKNSKNNNYINAIENLIINYKATNAGKIKENYLNYISNQKKINLELLKTSIQASEKLYAYKETDLLYQELIKIEPTSENTFMYGTFLQNINKTEKSKKQFDKAIRIIDKENKTNETKLLKAHTLNNQSTILARNNEMPSAIKKMGESLNIYIELEAETESKIYLLDIASTMNNLSTLLASVNEKDEAETKRRIATDTVKYLLESDPENIDYKIEFARIILNGVLYFGDNKSELKIAEQILLEEKHNDTVKYLLDLVKQLRIK